MRGTLLPWALTMGCASAGYTCPNPMPQYSPDVAPEDWGMTYGGRDYCGPICPNGEGYPGVDNPRFVIVPCKSYWCGEGYNGYYCVSRAGLEAYVAANPEVGELWCAEVDRDPDFPVNCLNIDAVYCYPTCQGK